MKKCFSVLALCFAAGVSACATEPQVPPFVGDAELSATEINPGESLGIVFDLQVSDPGSITRMHVRGLPDNSLQAGTETELPLPSGQSTSYDERIVVEKPAADGRYNLDLVIETTGKVAASSKLRLSGRRRTSPPRATVWVARPNTASPKT